MTTDEAKVILKIVLGGWPTSSAHLTPELVRAMAVVWLPGLLDLDFAMTERAVQRLARTVERMPTLATIRAAVHADAAGPRRAGAEAWEEVRRGFGGIGANRPFTSADPVTVRVVAALGWKELCLSENQVADRARFIEAYDAIARESRVVAAASPGALGTAAPQLAAGASSGGSAAARLIADAARATTPEPVTDEGPDAVAEHLERLRRNGGRR